MKKIGLRIDVDTLEGTLKGVPNLLRLFEQYDIKATFYFSLGPDNMGRHVWRLLRPRFLKKMLRFNASSLYGWNILTASTLWPGKKIAKYAAEPIKMTNEAGHEIGIHAWDHHAWQRHISAWSDEIITQHIELATIELEQLIGRPIITSAVPDWRANDRVINLKQNFHFTFNSDCRGWHPFYPILPDGEIGRLQIPVSLPTYDEVINDTVVESQYNEFILNHMKMHLGVPVYTIHAEVEGMKKLQQFEALIKLIKSFDLSLCPLSELIPKDKSLIPKHYITKGYISGREGWLAIQADAED